MKGAPGKGNRELTDTLMCLKCIQITKEKRIRGRPRTAALALPTRWALPREPSGSCAAHWVVQPRWTWAQGLPFMGLGWRQDRSYMGCRGWGCLQLPWPQSQSALPLQAAPSAFKLRGLPGVAGGPPVWGPSHSAVNSPMACPCNPLHVAIGFALGIWLK